MGRTTFTREEKDMIRSAGLAVWQYIGYDVMEAMNAEGKRRLPRKEIIELIMDADRLTDALRKMKAPSDLISRVDLASSRQISRILEEQFTCAIEA